jgi:hypothetical protein
MRAVLIGMLVLGMSGAAAAAAQRPFNVTVVVEQPDPFASETYTLVKLRAGDPAPVLRRVLDGPAMATVSHDRQRVFVVTSGASAGLRIDVFDSDDFAPLSTQYSPAPAHLVGAPLAELPNRPGVLAVARCWWIDTATGAMIESPQTLGLNCYPYVVGAGLSASGRYLLLEDDRRPDSAPRSLLVDVDNPRVPLLELPQSVGPILDDDSAVVVYALHAVELRSINGAPTRQIPIPEDWEIVRWIGAHRGVLYGTRYDRANYRVALFRLDTHSGAWVTIAPDTALGFDATADFNGRWALFTKPVEQICMIICFYVGASQTLLDIESGAFVDTAWLSGGPILAGRGLLAATPALPVDTRSTPLAPLLLIGLVGMAARRRLSGAISA